MRSEDMVRELVTGEVDRVYASTIRGRPDRWNAELWGNVYEFKQGGEDKERIALGINSPLGWTLSMATL